MTDRRPTPVLWLSGPPGAGKSTVGWELFTRLTGSGAQGAYVDVDQLGMCYPERPSDPGRLRLQAANLAAVVAGHRAAGAGYVVVSGVDVAELPGAVVTSCRLRAEPAEIARRLAARPGGGDRAEDESGTGVDTTGRSVAEVADEVQRRIGAWPAPVAAPGADDNSPDGTGAIADELAAADDPPHTPGGGDTGGTLLWLSGPTGVGKSTIGFGVYLRTLAAGVPAAYLDVEQLAHAGPRPAGPELRAANLAAVWRGHRGAGARVAVVTGPVHDLRPYAEALPGATITLCRLHAGPADRTARILARGAGGSWAQPGDPLRGRPEAYLRAVAARTEPDGPGHPIDTGGCSVETSVDRVLAATGWPPS